MTSDTTKDYQNYFVFPFTDPGEPKWLTEYELPEVSRKLSDQEVSVIAATLVLTLPEPPTITNWS